MKTYPAVVYAQTAIVAAIAAAKEVVNLDSIAAIEIATSRRGYEQAGRDREKWSPRNRDTANRGLPYITARAMLDGDISNDSYAPEPLRDPRVLALPRPQIARCWSARGQGARPLLSTVDRGSLATPC